MSVTYVIRPAEFSNALMYWMYRILVYDHPLRTKIADSTAETLRIIESG